MNCDICKRPIKVGKRIIDNGIKHICSSEHDLFECKLIQIEQYENSVKEERIKHEEFLKNNGKLVSCSNGHSFYTVFPYESYPASDECPECGEYVHDDRSSIH
jgi:hypothetical protein